MSAVVITNEADRLFLCRMIAEAPIGTSVRLIVDAATEAQRKRMWAMLGEVAKVVPHKTMDGAQKFYEPEQWKLLLMQACGQEVEMMPSLDGSTFLPYEGRSSHMNALDMSELISFIDYFGTTNGVEFKQ